MKPKRNSTRRRSTRLWANVPIELMIQKEGEVGWRSVPAESIDISHKGIAVQLSEPLTTPKSLRVKLNLSHDEKSAVELDSQVAWTSAAGQSAKMLCGLRFDGLSNSQLESLNNYIQTLRHVKKNKLKVDRRNYDYSTYYVNSLKEFSIHIYPKEIDGPAMPIVQANGKEVISLCSNNALGMAYHPDVIAASCDMTRRYGTSCGSSRLVAGNLSIQLQLERAIAAYMGREAGMVFMTGYMANIGALISLTNAVSFKGESIGETAIFCDRENHNSIIVACRLCETLNGAHVRYYRHRNMKSLERLLEESTAARKLIITEGVFSMIGDVGPLNEVADLAQKYHALTFLDDSHGIGMLGPSGRGTIDLLKETRMDIVMGTFSKAFGGVGGFIVGKQELIDYIKVQAPTYIFSSALPPGTVGGILKAIELVDRGEALRTQLFENVEYFKAGVSKAGFTLLDTGSHIVPILIGEGAKAVQMTEKLFARGTFIQEIPWPAVPKNRSLLRCIPTVLHTRQQLDKVITDLIEIGREEEVIPS